SSHQEGRAMSLQTPEEILDEVSGVRDHLMRELEKASSGPRGGRLPRGGRAPRTREEGLAWGQGRVGADVPLPPLDYYFAAMRRCGLPNMPTWDGEPQDELKALEIIDQIIACCRAAVSGLPPAEQGAEVWPALLSAADLADRLNLRSKKNAVEV